jgi:hypothetical protein
MSSKSGFSKLTIYASIYSSKPLGVSAKFIIVNLIKYSGGKCGLGKLLVISNLKLSAYSIVLFPIVIIILLPNSLIF